MPSIYYNAKVIATLAQVPVHIPMPGPATIFKVSLAVAALIAVRIGLEWLQRPSRPKYSPAVSLLTAAELDFFHLTSYFVTRKT
jgi:hypothetical protein